MKRPNSNYLFTKEMALQYQAEDLAKWEKVLKPEVFAKLKELVTRNNDNVARDDVCRGNDINHFVCNAEHYLL